MGKKSIKSSRNVLALPEEPFWPALETENETSLLDNLTETLKIARTIHPLIKWSEVRKMNKEQKAKHVEQFFMNLSAEEQAQHEIAKQLKKHLAIGINEVSRGLEKKELACCLVHGQAKPKIIITHIVQLACSRRVPILIVNDLKQSLKESLGFSSLAIGFLKDVSLYEKHKFHELCKHISNLSKEFINDSEELADVAHDGIAKTKYKKSTDSDLTKMINDCSSLYLYRTSSDYRVFHPPDNESISDIAGDKVTISADKFEDDCPIPTKKNKFIEDDCPVPCKKTKFIEPNILRVHSNPKKARKKKQKITG